MRPLRDPAPSRLAYRLNRLMLTPRFRLFLRYGLPVLTAAAAVAFWASDETRRDAARAKVEDLRHQIEQRPEFMVRLMSLENASDDVARDIREMLPIRFPVSSFDLDLDALRAEIETLDAVASASLRVRSGGVLDVDIEEREPAVVWRGESGLELLDATGHPVKPAIARTDRPDLPLIVGKGADARVAEALALVETAAPVAGRLRGLVRVGERRWDIVLDRDQRILLPEDAAVTALERVMTLDAAQDLLARAVVVVDMRNAARPVLRLAPEPTDSLLKTDWDGR